MSRAVAAPSGAWSMAVLQALALCPATLWGAATTLLGGLAAVAATDPATEAPAVGATGGLVAIPLPQDTAAARHRDIDVLIVREHAIVPIPLDAEAGPDHIEAETSGGARLELPFEVTAKEYPEQHLRIDNERLVNPLAADMERIDRERAIMFDAFARRSPMQDDPVPVLMPVQGTISSPFGLRRVLNGQPRSPHTGLDIAAATGTPIAAPMPGTVVATGHYFFNGNTILVDHGGGLVSMFCHLHEIRVEPNARLARGAVIGTVGATGRVTGAHLHWTVSLAGVRVDPDNFMAVLNGLAGAQ